MYLFAGVARSMVNAITDPIGLHHADLANNVLGQHVTEAAFMFLRGPASTVRMAFVILAEILFLNLDLITFMKATLSFLLVSKGHG